jgi:hypothetical protein
MRMPEMMRTIENILTRKPDKPAPDKPAPEKKPNTVLCPRCGGKRFINKKKCDYCGGFGRVHPDKGIDSDAPFVLNSKNIVEHIQGDLKGLVDELRGHVHCGSREVYTKGNIHSDMFNNIIAPGKIRKYNEYVYIVNNDMEHRLYSYIIVRKHETAFDDDYEVIRISKSDLEDMALRSLTERRIIFDLFDELFK